MHNQADMPDACLECASIENHAAGADNHHYTSPEDATVIGIAGCVDGLVLENMVFVFEHHAHELPPAKPTEPVPRKQRPLHAVQSALNNRTCRRQQKVQFFRISSFMPHFGHVPGLSD